MTHPYIANTEAWCFALRILMGYPPYAPDCHTLAFCSSAPRNLIEAMQITTIARDMQRDVIHVAFERNDVAIEPRCVSMAVRQDHCVQWMPGCRLYAAGETARIELLAGDRRWFVGQRNVLTSAKLPPKGRREQGEAIAMRRWRQVVARMGPLKLDGSLWVRSGGRFADAIPMEELQIAA